MRALLVLIPATFAFAPQEPAAQDMRPGRYRMTATLLGGPQSIAPTQDESCVTQRDIDQAMARFGGDEDECRPSGIKRGSGRVSYTMTCIEHTRRVEKSIEGRMTPDAFDFTITTEAKDAPKPPRLQIRGTRLGDCR